MNLNDIDLWTGTINLFVIFWVVMTLAITMYMKPGRFMKQTIPDNEKWLHTPETVLHLTDEQKPRFIEAALAGRGLPDDIVASFMQQLFPNDRPTYDPDDGPLTETELNQVRVQAAPKLGKGPVLRRRSLLEDSDD